MEYVATAHPPSIVTHSILTNLTSPSHQTLVVVKGDGIEAWDLTEQGMVSACKPLNLYGAVGGIAQVRKNDKSAPLLLVLVVTPAPAYLLIQFNPSTSSPSPWAEHHISPHAQLSVSEFSQLPDPRARPGEFYMGCSVTDDGKVAVLSFWTGVITVLVFGSEEESSSMEVGDDGDAPVVKRSSKHAKSGLKSKRSAIVSKFDIRIPQLNLISITFLSTLNSLSPSTPPSLAFLSVTPQRTLKVQAFSLLVSARELSANELFSSAVEDESSDLIISIPLPSSTSPTTSLYEKEGLLVLGSKEIVFFELVSSTFKSPGKSKGKGRSMDEDLASSSAPLEKGKRRRSSAASVSNAVGPNPFSIAGASNSSAVVVSTGNGKAVNVTRKAVGFGVLAAYAVIDASPECARIAVGDEFGKLSVVLLRRDSVTKQTNIEVVSLGEISSPSTITYLSSSRLFVGSTCGDSQLIVVNPDVSDTSSNHLSTAQEWTNLGPIVDFCTLAEDGGGGSQTVTCSGGQNRGSLRILKRGVSLEELLTVEGIEDVSSIFPLSSDGSDHNLILLSFWNSSALLQVTGFSEDDASIEVTSSEVSYLFCTDAPTLAAGKVLDSNSIVQVTTQSIRIIDVEDGLLSHEWRPEAPIVAAAASLTEVVVGHQGGSLCRAVLSLSQFETNQIKQFENEITTVALFTSTGGSQFYAVACLGSTNTVHILDGESFETKFTTTVFSYPTSLLFLEPKPGQLQLLVGMGNGTLSSLTLDSNGAALLDSRAISLGSQDVRLSQFETASSERAVLATADRSSVLYEDQGRLASSSVNLKSATASASFHSAIFPFSTIVASDGCLLIGRIDEFKKVQVKTIPLGLDAPQRICYSHDLRLFGVACIRTSLTKTNEIDHQTSSLKIFDQDTFYCLQTYNLKSYERVASLELVTLDGAFYFALGTAFTDSSRGEPEQGRVLLFSEDPHNYREIRLVTEVTVSGAAYALTSVQGRLAAAVNSRVVVFDLQAPTASKKILSQVTDYGCTFVACSLVSHNEYLIVGDGMSSITILRISDNQLKQVSRDARPLWMVSVECLNEDTVIGAESNMNLVTMKAEGSRMTAAGSFHVGEIVTRFRSMAPVDATAIAKPNLVFASTKGRISAIIDLDSDLSRLLFDLQRNMGAIYRGPGDVDNSDWRAAKNDKGKTTASVGFIDGDFVESFLDLEEDDALMVLEGSNKFEKIALSSNEIRKRLEGLKRLH